MRLILELEPEKFLPYSRVNKHTIQGAIYYLLDNTEYANMHSVPRFKFFSYSDIFPPDDFYPNKEKTLIISSPNPKFINAIYNNAKKIEHFYLSDTPFKIKSIKKVSLRPNGRFITGSPIVLQIDKENSIYFSFKRGGTLKEFLTLVKQNAIKKYNAYYDDELTLDEEIFDMLQFKKEVAITLKKNDKSFVIIGSMWNLLEKKIPKGYGKFYRFIMDCGLGEKNSLGFGFLNVLR